MHRFAPMQKTLARALLLAAVILTLVAQPVLGGDELIVQPGDTLWDIAQANRTTVAALAQLNGIPNPSLIVVGQRIVLHPPTAPASPPPAPAAVNGPRRSTWFAAVTRCGASRSSSRPRWPSSPRQTRSPIRRSSARGRSS